MVEYALDGVQPTCKCGCGTPVHLRAGTNEFWTWIRGHVVRVRPNWTEEGILKSSETRRKQFKNGERQPWNKGLKGEEYLKHYDKEDGTNSLMEIYKDSERNKKISENNKGKIFAEEHKKKLGIKSKKYWSKQENRNKQSNKRLEYIKKNGFVFKSTLELRFAELLKNLNINYEEQFRIENVKSFYDFYLPEYNILIEVDGDYWHCNPRKYKEPIYDAQKHNVKKDIEKNKLALDNGYNLIRFWEYDIKNNIEQVIETLKEEINKSK